MKRHLITWSCSRRGHFLPGESALDRHVRRMQAAESETEMVQHWCVFRGIQFYKSCQNGHPHALLWKFRVNLPKGAALAIWNPALGWAQRIGKIAGREPREWAAFVNDKLYDVDQLIVFLEQWLSSIPKRSEK